jgi:hypothetical protein
VTKVWLQEVKKEEKREKADKEAEEAKLKRAEDHHHDGHQPARTKEDKA